jgi:5-methyltetrahydrofolate--homocysteine methyltransferase
MEIIKEIAGFLTKGRSRNVKELVQQALDAGVDPKQILNEGLLEPMMALGERFKREEVFVPEVPVAAKALNAGLTLLEPKLIEVGNVSAGKVVIGTVKGDMHDIGKNLVSMMLKGAGFEIYDIGVNAEVSVFIDKAEEVGADIICISALLTTTTSEMKHCIDELMARGLREKYIVMVGGAPVTAEFAEAIGADYYTKDAASAAIVAKEAMAKKQ